MKCPHCSPLLPKDLCSHTEDEYTQPVTKGKARLTFEMPIEGIIKLYDLWNTPEGRKKLEDLGIIDIEI